jgi:hypothetical protein
MSITSIQLVDTDLSTVLFDLHSADGSTNSSWGSVITKFGLGGSFTVTAPHEAGRFPRSGSDGAFTTFSRRGLGQASWRQFISGTTEANLRLGTGRLADLITRGCILKIVTSAVTRYLRFEPSGYPTPFQGKDSELADLYAMFKFQQGLDVSVACQPYWEGAEVSVSGVTVPNDPATSTKVRVFPVTGVTGDLPTPARIRTQMDAGSPAVERVFHAWRPRNTRPSSYFADYLSDTGYLNLDATGRGWTIALGTGTTSVADAAGSGGNVARVQTTANDSVSIRRVRATRTTKLDSIRGPWDVWCRLRCPSVSTHLLTLGWGPSTADPVPFLNTPFTLDLTGAVSFFMDKRIGRIYIPDDPAVVLGGLALELWTQRTAGSGTINLDTDFLWLTPADHNGTTLAPASAESILGSLLTTPSGTITGDPSLVAGSVVGSMLRLDANNESGGWGPTAGTVYGTGRHYFDFTVTIGGAPNLTVACEVVNKTDNTTTAVHSATYLAPETFTRRLAFDGVAAKNYIPRVRINGYTSGRADVASMAHTIIPSLGTSESVRTDPTRLAVDRLDSSANLAGYLGLEGELPALLEPGDNHIMVRVDELGPQAMPEHLQNTLARTPTVSVIYSPRYAL